jgi:hypothetical protein
MTGKQLVGLTDRIVKAFNASDWEMVGTLLGVEDAIHSRERLLRSQRFGDEDYQGEALIAVKKIIEADPKNHQLLIDYLNDKHPLETDVAAEDYISSSDEGGRRIVFSPLEFKVPTKLPSSDLISVMMPFGAATLDTYKSIKEAAEDAGFSCKRADDMWESSTVIQDVFSLIYDSYIVVCDFSGKNPNVFYEAGIAHTLGKHVVPITQHLDDIPFDLSHHRHAKYLDNKEGRSKLKAELTRRFQTLRTAV